MLSLLLLPRPTPHVMGRRTENALVSRIPVLPISLGRQDLVAKPQSGGSHSLLALGLGSEDVLVGLLHVQVDLHCRHVALLPSRVPAELPALAPPTALLPRRHAPSILTAVNNASAGTSGVVALDTASLHSRGFLEGDLGGKETLGTLPTRVRVDVLDVSHLVCLSLPLTHHIVNNVVVLNQVFAVLIDLHVLVLNQSRRLFSNQHFICPFYGSS